MPLEPFLSSPAANVLSPCYKGSVPGHPPLPPACKCWCLVSGFCLCSVTACWLWLAASAARSSSPEVRWESRAGGGSVSRSAVLRAARLRCQEARVACSVVSGGLAAVPCESAGEADLKPNQLFGFLGLPVRCRRESLASVAWTACPPSTPGSLLRAAMWGEPAAVVKGGGLAGSGGMLGSHG